MKESKINEEPRMSDFPEEVGEDGLNTIKICVT